MKPEKASENSEQANQQARRSDFVADGANNLAEAVRASVIPAIKAAVTEAYADRLANAGFVRRAWLRWRMNAEIERRTKQAVTDQMPSDESLY